jgi:hypothetical protein
MKSRKLNENEVVKAPSIRPLAESVGWWQGMQAWRAPQEQAPVVDERFVPFDQGALRAEANAAPPPEAPAAPIRSPATLVELGLPEELARGLEVTMRVMGATRQGEVIGFRFRTPDGTEHRLRVDEAA